MNNKKEGYLAVISGLIIMICLGVAYSWGIFLIPIIEEFKTTRASVSLIGSLLLFIFSLFIIIGGFLSKKLNGRKTSIIGGIFILSGWILSSFAKSVSLLWISFGILVGIGSGLSYSPSISTGIKWFPEKKGFITGIIVFGFGFGSAFIAPVGTKLILNFGWRTTMFIYGISFGIIISIFSNFLKEPEKINNLKNINEELNQNKDLKPLEMLKTKSFKIIFFTYFISMIAVMMIVGHIVPFLKNKGFTPIQASFALTFISIFNGLGRISGGFFSDKFGPKNTLTFNFIILGIVLLIFNYLPFLYLIYLFAGIIGLCFGGFVSIHLSLTSSLFGIENFGINFGFVGLGYGFGCFIGPYLGGLIYDITNQYKIAFTIGSILSFFGALITYFLLKKYYDKI